MIKDIVTGMLRMIALRIKLLAQTVNAQRIFLPTTALKSR